MRFRVPQVRRRVVTFGAALCIASAAVMHAQNDKVSTPEDLDRVMKKAQPAMQATQKALAAGVVADAKTQLGTVRQAILDSQHFWVEQQRDDALTMNKDTLAKIDALDKVLSGDTVDPAAATTALKEVGGSCRTCHQKYRATDSEDNYIIKPGSLDKVQ